MKLIFVTGNKDKLKEAKQILKDKEIQNKKLDLPELQGERHQIVKQKAKIAAEKLNKPCFVDDTSLCFNALNDLPGVYIKHFLEKLGRKGLVSLLAAHKDKSAKAIAMIGYCRPDNEPVCFEGITEGKIVEPKGDRFGWDPIFLPKDHKKTYAQMSQEEKNKISHRKKALKRLKIYLDQNG